jgi:acylpyruvate hydrolase
MNTVDFKGEFVTPSKVVCIGKNYYSHIKEMGGQDRPQEPVIFIKPNSAIISGAKYITIQQEYGLLHHEVELCFIVREKCKGIDKIKAKQAIAGYAVGIDFTLRTKQEAFKKAGEPWAISKGFDGSGVYGTFIGAEKVPNPCNLDISLKVNGEYRHKANTSQMIFKPEEILSYVSHYMTLEQGDIIMCGTPEGVGEVKKGDELYALIEGLQPLSFKVIR